MMLLSASILIIVSLAGILLYREYFVKRGAKKRVEEKYKVFEPVIRKLLLKEHIHPDEILAFVADPSTRHAMFGILQEHGRSDLFPIEYLTQEKAAESFLVTWLEFPTELGASPDEIKLITKFVLQENDIALSYYVFKFRTFPPHRSSGTGWMIGAAGPYLPESLPYDIPKRMYSRFKELGKVSIENEVQWVHDNIAR